MPDNHPHFTTQPIIPKIKNKAIFLDRDGVLNVEIGDYITTQEDFVVAPNVPESLKALKQAGYLLIVITNQGGISKGRYAKDLVHQLHQKIQAVSDNALDGLYFAASHRQHSATLMPKPSSLMLEKAIAKYNIDPSTSYMVGDANRDMVCADAVGVRGIFIIGKPGEDAGPAIASVHSLAEAVKNVILK